MRRGVLVWWRGGRYGDADKYLPPYLPDMSSPLVNITYIGFALPSQAGFRLNQILTYYHCLPRIDKRILRVTVSVTAELSLYASRLYCQSVLIPTHKCCSSPVRQVCQSHSSSLKQYPV